MATFPVLEDSRALGDPVALYYFAYGDDAASFYAWTDANHTINAPGRLLGSNVDYTPMPIMRGNIVQGGTLDRTSLELRAPRNLPLALLFEIWPPSQVVTCVIRQGHLGETDGLYPACWSGRVTAISFEASEAVFALEPVITSLRRTGLRRNYQFGCPHALYGTQCLANKTVATTSVNITSITTDTIVMPAAWFGALNPSKYVGGMIEWTSPLGNHEIRTILGIISGKDLSLNGVVTSALLPNGTAVDVVLGCNHQAGFADTVGDCNNLHIDSVAGGPNIRNFGGQPWIPLINPVSSVLMFR